MNEFLGRDEELDILHGWFDYVVKNRKPLLGVVVADSGWGKTRLVQALYERRLAHYKSDQNPSKTSDWNPNEYWPQDFGGDSETLEVNPKFPDGYTRKEELGPPKFMWLGVRFQNPKHRTAITTDSVRPILKHRASVHRDFIEILQHPGLWKELLIAMGQKKGEYFEGVLENQLDKVIELGGDIIAEAMPGFKPTAQAARWALKQRNMQRLQRSGTENVSARQEAADKRALDELTTELERLRESGKGGNLPIILWLDDAQWIDEDSLAVVDELLEKAKLKKITLMVIATHWRKDWTEYSKNKSGIIKLFDPNFFNHAKKSMDDPKEIEIKGEEDTPIQNNILKLGKMQNDQLEKLLTGRLPGLRPTQREQLLKKMEGHILSLIQIISFVKDEPKNFEDDDNQKPLTSACMKEIQERDTKRAELAQFYFHKKLDYGERLLLGFAGQKGLQFNQRMVVHAVNSLINRGNKIFLDLKWKDAGERLKKLRDFEILTTVEGDINWEFRDLDFYRVSHSYYKDKLHAEHHDLIESTNQDAMIDQINSCFDDDGEEVTSENSDIGSKPGAKGTLAALPSERRMGFLEQICAQLDPSKSAPESREELAGLRAHCLVFQEYVEHDMVREANRKGEALAKYLEKNKFEETDYIRKLGKEFRMKLCDYMEDIGSYRAALSIAESLEADFERQGEDTDSKRETAVWQRRIAKIIIEAENEHEETSMTLNKAEEKSNNAWKTFDELDYKERGPDWYINTADCKFFLAQAKYALGQEDEGKVELGKAKGLMKNLCDSFDEAKYYLEHARFLARVRHFRCQKEDWKLAKDEALACVNALSEICDEKAYEKELEELEELRERPYKISEEHAEALEALGDIIRHLEPHDDLKHYEESMEIRRNVASRSLEDFKKGLEDTTHKNRGVRPLEYYRKYFEFAFRLGENDEKKGNLTKANAKLDACLKALQECHKGLGDDIETIRYYSDMLWKVGELRYNRVKPLEEETEKKKNDAQSSLAKVKETVKSLPGAKSLIESSRAKDLKNDEFLKKLVDEAPETERDFSKDHLYKLLNDEAQSQKDICHKHKFHMDEVLVNIKSAQEHLDEAEKQFVQCEKHQELLTKELRSPETHRDRARTMLHRIDLQYVSYRLRGLNSQSQAQRSVSVNEAADKMLTNIESMLGICQEFERYDGFGTERKSLEKWAGDLLDDIRNLKESDDQVDNGGLQGKCKGLSEEFSKYEKELDRLGSPAQIGRRKVGGFRERIAAMRLRQVIGAAVPLALVLFILFFLTFVTIVDLKVHTARPAAVSWESIEGGTGRLFGRTWLWTDTARVRASAPGHRSAEAVLSKDGTGGFEFVLEPLPGIAEIDIVGDGPITLSVDGAARQAQPSMRIELAHGPHKALLAGPNIVPTEIDFEMQGFGNVQQFQWSALSANSFLDVQVHPRTAEVLLDGQPWAVGTRNAGVSLGRHTLSAKIPGWYSKSEDFQALADNTASFRWTLRPKPAVLALSTEPSGVAVLLNGDYVGQSPVSLDLPANRRHVISARQSGRDPVELALSPAPGERMKRTLRLEARTAKVAFSASGPATVRVNGVHAGTLPLAVELRKGDRVEAVADGLAAAPYVVTKLEDVTGSHRFQLMPPAQLAHRSAPELEEVLPGLKLKRIPWSAMGATVSRPFRIAVQEVTYAAYSELLSKRPPSGLTARHPIVNISWAQAAQFANALSTKRGLPPVYVFDRFGNLLSVNQQSLGFRLPTEAEWLAAAGPGWAHPKGVVRPNWAGSERRSGPRMADHTDRHMELAPAQQAVVGAFDLRGMAGNAAEWLHDYYAPWPSSPPRGYAGPTLGIDHAVRGGSYLTAEKPEARGFSANPRPDLGFRVAQWLH